MLFIKTLLLLQFVVVGVAAMPVRQHSVNAVLGDISFVKTFGFLPTAQTNEQVRIRTHLAYVEQMLRQANIEHLSLEQQKKRTFLLDKLHEYWMVGRFPKNLDYIDGRRPCFIDKYGNICAVGYLMAMDAGQEAAEYVNEQAKYLYIQDIKIAVLDEWIKQSGLSNLECAMIQPTYQSYIPDPVFTITEMTPTSTSANGQVFDITFVVDGIPTTATATTNPFTVGSFGLALLPLGVPIYTIDWADGEYRIQLSPVNFYLSNSLRYPGRTQGTITFRIRGTSLKAIQHNAFLYYREPIPRYFVVTQKNYYTSQPAQLNVQQGTSHIFHNSAFEVVAFPNPMITTLGIQSSSRVQRIKLWTINGTEVFSKQIQQYENLDVVDISALPSGAYFLEVHSDKATKIQKLIKQ